MQLVRHMFTCGSQRVFFFRKYCYEIEMINEMQLDKVAVENVGEMKMGER